MAEVTEDTIRHVAALARLSLSSEEVGYYQRQISQVVEYFNQMDQMLDSLGEGWRADTQGEKTPERPDTANAGAVSVDQVMSQAPSKVGTAFQVPAIIE